MNVTFEQVSKQYGPEIIAVRDASFSANPGELVVLLGESGSGKTTTLKLVNRLIEPTAGRILIERSDIATADPVELRRSIGYVFQGVGLFPHMSIFENVAITPRLLGWSAPQTNARVDRLLHLVHLDPGKFRDRMPDELSGGQQQRVGFARALAAEPRLMLLDEPFGALDPLTRDSLRDDFRQIHKDLSLTSILVTHDMTEALMLADRVIVFRDGCIRQNGTPHELMASPADRYVEQLLSTPKRQAKQLDALLAESSGDLPGESY